MVPQSANAAEAALLARKKAAKNQPKPPFNPSDPSTWPQATPGRVAQMQADQGYKPLTGKATGQYVAPDTNMYNATPTDVARGTVGFLNSVRDSFGRTLSTQNLQKALNPNTNETDRALAIVEDTLNIASVVPGVRAIGGYIDDAVRFADDGVNALARAISNRKNKNSFQPLYDQTKYLSPRASNAQRLQRDLETELYWQSEQSKIRPEVDLGISRSPYPEPTEWKKADLPEGMDRFWHTTPTGGRLPNELMTTKEAARIPSRRGSGSSQLLSGGPYATNAGGVSVTYFDGFNDVVERFPGSVLPDDLIYNQLAVPAIHEQNWRNIPKLTSETINNIRKMQIDDFMSDLPTLDSPIEQVPFAPATISRDAVQSGAWKGKTVREVLESAQTPEEALRIIDDSLRPITYKPAQKPWDNRGLAYDSHLAAQNERINFKHPIVKNPDGSYSKTAIVSPNTGLYLGGRHNATAAQPFSDSYRLKLRELADENFAKIVSNLKEQYPGMSDSAILSLASRESGPIPQNNAYGTFWENRANPIFMRSAKIYPGQNYWDLPVVRNEEGVIESIGGLKAIDIDSASPKVFNELADNIENFVVQQYPNLNQQEQTYVQNLIQRIRNLPNSEIRTTAFTHIQNELDSLLTGFEGFLDRSVELSPKEKMYEYLQELGYGVIPHTGGQVTRGQEHLAINILKPEQLPPSQYLEGGFSNYEELIGSIARQKAIQLRDVMSQGTGRELTGYLAQERMNKRLTDATRAALLAPIASTPRQATSNR